MRDLQDMTQESIEFIKASQIRERGEIMGKAKVEIGLRVFNRGDMANHEHWGTITRIIHTTGFADQVEITPDPDSDRKKPYTVYRMMISDVDKGNGSTRIVTEAAYMAYRKEAELAWEQRMAELGIYS